MSISTTWNKLSMAVAGATLIVGTFHSAPANAITFKFQGDAEDAGSVEGSYTVADDILKTLVSDVRIQAPFLQVENPLDFFSFTVNGNNIFSGKPSYSSLTSLIPVNGVFAFREVLRLDVIDDRGLFFAFKLDVATADEGLIEPVDQCLVKECQGFLGFALGGGINSPPGVIGGGFVPHKPVNDVESVPEPTAAIALGIIGASMLIRKRKLSSSLHA
ncbi:PEP-CTERM sorting domain-containing protein [Coleofasciculus sp. FACHB-64]|uniref:PEP-CTERM sorting domain-containing protein n=1 Tax=Cyanophyceae TaxID=3028117 RepID=UPI0016871F1D|nr:MULTISPECIES: PEP-CTERM sorting domain-containing protein [unclassified Coleofasciculus]MBD1836834.1 PEP-CTERM sorting domain-containing protein [Coleofasciculus sp. FACHB-501]MBD1897425.1 PEP-CTERM sorting domain-containing protein [Coleofasciculus sp. FACHB-129]MBD2046774.1 PEP-CTERM sorting domain-containing protein [Coleofasciculus sp. FACHB-64]MBD2084507.1 PEP-CTERM sorting domain-containing protein [Coleofasciculus sp. FACHB-542]